ncbi:MAG: hypothetical protein AAFW81_12565 [Pseudomonadota bacterium]
MGSSRREDSMDFAWRRPAPLARRAAMALYSWQRPHISYFACLLAAAPFILAAIYAPALLSLSATVDMLAPIADARAARAGEIALIEASSPFYLLTLMIGDVFADSPGRIHLVSKAVCALFVLAPAAYFAVSRLPVFAGATLVAALAGFVASPFAGPAEFALALFLVSGFCFLSATADPEPGRARVEGLFAGAILFALWTLNPVFSLAGFIALSACPFLSGPCGLTRYAATFASFVAFAAVAEWLAPGLNMARAAAASGTLAADIRIEGGASALGLGGVAVSAALVVMMTAIFGGREHWRASAIAAVFCLFALIAGRIAGANTFPVFVLAAIVAAFSVTSPFYDGLFRNHDRASVSVALAAAILPLFWTIAMVVQSAGQFALQSQTAKAAPGHIRTELALVQPGGPMLARWIEEGRFSTPEAREFLALNPIDQSAVLLEAASRARPMTASGHEVAILAGTDAACVISNAKPCRRDSNDAAKVASVVFVPRLDLGPGAAAAKGRAEALLYTEFRLVEETPFWEIWVRRNALSPKGML